MFFDLNFNFFIMIRIFWQGFEYLNYRLDNLFVLEVIYVLLVEENGILVLRLMDFDVFGVFFNYLLFIGDIILNIVLIVEVVVIKI